MIQLVLLVDVSYVYAACEASRRKESRIMIADRIDRAVPFRCKFPIHGTPASPITNVPYFHIPWKNTLTGYCFFCLLSRNVNAPLLSLCIALKRNDKYEVYYSPREVSVIFFLSVDSFHDEMNATILYLDRSA